MKIEPKQLVPDEALYREMRLNYRDYFTGGMGAESVRDLLDAMDLAATADELRDVIANGKGQKRSQGHQAPQGGRRVPQVREQADGHDSRCHPGDPRPTCAPWCSWTAAASRRRT